LAVLSAELALSVRQESQTWDEACHIFAGYSYWTRADFGMNPEHPPFVKLLATLPLLGMPLRTPTIRNRDFKVETFLDGHDFLYSNNADAILFRTRMAASILTLLLALLVFAAAREMFDSGTAFIALILFTFEPNLLAHGALVTTDMGVTCFLFATVYAFYRYVKRPTIWRLLAVGSAAGLALATKHSAILLLPILILLAAAEVFQGSAGNARGKILPRGKLAAQLTRSLAVIALMAVLILWSTYGFHLQMRPAGLKMNPSLAKFAGVIKHPAEIHAILAMARWHILPEAFLYGLVDVQRVTDSSATYLLGKVYPSGQWFYFPVAFVIKETLPMLLLLLLSPIALYFRRCWDWRRAAFLVVPPALYFVVAMFSGLNIGIRHILPIFPFVGILAAAVAWTLWQRHGAWRYVVAGLLMFHIVSSLRSFPNYLAYSNEVWGGPSNTYKWLSDSNVDWGQQLKATSRYLQQREIKNCWFAYFATPAADPGYYGIPCKPLTTIATMWLHPLPDTPQQIDGTVLVSAGVLSGYELGPGEMNPYEQFQKLRPIAEIQDGVFVFDGDFNIPLAAALNHVGKVWHLAASGDLNGAVTEARTAVAIAPNSIRAQEILGDMLIATNHPKEARQAYTRALTLTSSLPPEYQQYWDDILHKDLATR
jgi:Dolichyl-phosphate-mannose-protein mannosyltransferase